MAERIRTRRSGGETGPVRSRLRVGLPIGAALLMGAVAGAPPAAPTATRQPPPLCSQPFLPMWAGRSEGAGTTTQIHPAEPLPIPGYMGESVAISDRLYEAGPDTDGDGVVDQIETDPDDLRTVVIVRGDGTLRISRSGWTLAHMSNYPTGDLDGDGRDEIVVLARADSGGDEVFIIPGDTPPGDHMVRDIGIEIPGYFVYAAGDQDGTPGSDLLVTVSEPMSTTSPESGVVDGATLMAVGAGGSHDGWPVTRTVPGWAVFAAELGSGTPTVVTYEGAGAGIRIRFIADGEEVIFAGVDALGDWSPDRVFLHLTSSGTFLWAATMDRGGSTTVVWDLGDPCAVTAESSGPATTAPSGAAPAEGSAPGASLVRGAPSYTG